MKFAILLTGAPQSSQAPQSALAFCRAAMAAGHQISHVFLYGEGVHLATLLATPPSDEVNWTERWRNWLIEAGCPATVCVASALRRGLLDQAEAARWDKSGVNIGNPWRIGGLGDWVEASLTADRVMVFEPAE